jgi:phosphoenolpyruvate carboxykinase (GTP)
MGKKYTDLLKKKLSKENFAKLSALANPFIIDFVGEYVELCTPQTVFVRTDSLEDINYIRAQALSLGEEKSLATKGHTFHFDGYFDQARDKKNTKYLLPKGSKLSSFLHNIEKNSGRKEIRDFLKESMSGRQMFVCFFSLGPVSSPFSILAVQLTDSAYVAHSEDILFRPGYEQFKRNKVKRDFFKFVHSAGELENFVSKNVDNRRIYIDLEKQLVYSVNTQYAGNTVGLKKLALRLAIKKASGEGWLAEHMFIMGVTDRNNKKAYFCGAYPSMCGKTSTAMMSGGSIIGDDITYLRVMDGKLRAVNVERGVFGIIKDVNSKDDPIIFDALNKEGEVIFSNVLIDEEKIPFWLGKSNDVPLKGINFSGPWFPGKIDAQGNKIPPSHKNARYTVRLKSLKNVDRNLESPNGVEVKGLIYGGRDSGVSVPVEQALNWQHGIIIKAAGLESETTAATLGKEGVKTFNPMSNIDFLSISLGKYIKMNLEVAKKLTKPPLIFSVNYFLRDKQGKFLNQIQDKLVWLKWMRLRVDKKVSALLTPTGLIPKYTDLKTLFKEFLKREYAKDDYVEQFKLRIPENLARLERIRNIYEGLERIPSCLFAELKAQERRLRACQVKFGDYVNPHNFCTIIE